MPGEIEEIKQKLDIVTVISRFLTLKKRGRHYLANCPFHNEKTPSFIISPELQIYKCFGCGKSGDIFSFVQEYERIDFKEALEELAKQAGVNLAQNYQLTGSELHKKRLIEVNNEVAKFYHYILTKHPLGKSALDYVLKRGITPSTIRLFGIGFSPRNGELLVNYLLKKGFKRDDLIATGTIGQSQYGNRLYDRFQDRLTFPLTDYRGRILGFSGRILPTAVNPNLAKYINSPETDIYHKSQMVYGLNQSKDAIRLANSVIVVEGEFDMISPFQSGFQNIVALKGTAFTQEQLQLLKRYTDTLILALDSDSAGNNAARKSIELADSMDCDIKVLTLGDKYKDPDEAIKDNPDFFRHQLEHALPVWDFLIQSVIKANNPDTIKGKKESLAILLPIITKISNTVIRADYLKKLSDEIGSNEQSVIEESKKYQTASENNPAAKAAAAISPPATTASTVLEKYEANLISLILGAKKPEILAKKLIDKLEFTLPKHALIIKKLQEVDTFDPKLFLDLLPPEMKPSFHDLYLEATQMELDSQARRLEIKKTVDRILFVSIKERLSYLSTKIAQLESSDDISALKAIELEYNQLLSRLSKLQTQKKLDFS